MAEKSLMWTTGALGDGAAAYTQAETIRWLRQTFLSDVTDEGVLKNYGDALVVAGVASPVAVGTGAAYVYGFPYWNTASVDVAVPTPVAATRIDRIVLQADWATQTVRIARVAGAEGGAAPALTQNDGVVWEISLARASITTGGVITVTSERVFAHPNVEVEAGMLADGAVDTTARLANDVVTDTKLRNSAALSVIGRATNSAGDPADIAAGSDHQVLRRSGTALAFGTVATAGIADSAVTAAKIADRTRRFLVQPQYGTSTDAQTAEGLGFELRETSDDIIAAAFYVPSDYVSGLTVTVMGWSAAGNIYCQTFAKLRAVGETILQHQINNGSATFAMTLNQLMAIRPYDISATAAAGDVISIGFFRESSQPADTVAGDLHVLGFLVEYTADS